MNNRLENDVALLTGFGTGFEQRRGRSKQQPVRSSTAHIEPKGIVGCFMIITAKKQEEAIQVARECPRLVAPGSSVGVRKIHPP